MQPRDIATLAVLLTGIIIFISQTPVTLPEGREVTYRRPAHSSFEHTATILFGGDMMFDRTIRQVMEREGGDFIFSCIADTLHSVDLVVANLEGPITDNPSMSLGSVIGSPENFTFTFPPETAALLKRHNIGLVNLGNNHILNFGWDGEKSTQVALEAFHVDYFGSPSDHSVALKRIQGVPLAFINYNEFAPNGWRENTETAVSQVAEARGKNLIPVVYTHWGDEYATTSVPRQKALAHELVDAGAEVVIGSHPHVVQEHEIYRGKHIYYSLGNFVFDQYWNEAVRTGLLLKIEFGGNGIEEVTEIPIDIRTDRRTCVL